MAAAGDPEDPDIVVQMPLPVGDNAEDPVSVLDSVRASVVLRSRHNKCVSRKASVALFLASTALGLSLVALMTEMNSLIRARLDFAHLEQLLFFP